MKKLFLLTLICVLSLSFVACEKKDDVEVITLEDIEKNEEFQRVLLQTTMVRSETMTTEERANFMLSLYRVCFEIYDGEKFVTNVGSDYNNMCQACVLYAFEDSLSIEVRDKLISLLTDPITTYVNIKITRPEEENEIDFDTLIPQLKEKALEILK